MFKQWLCVSIFFAAVSIDAADERPLLQRVCREVAKNVDIVAVERGAYAGLVTAAVLFIMHDGISGDTNSNGCNICQTHEGATLVVTNDGPVTYVDQQQPEVISLAKAFCPIL